MLHNPSDFKLSSYYYFQIFLNFLKMAAFHQFIFLVLVLLALPNHIMVVRGNEEPSVEIADVWGIATIPAGKQGIESYFQSPFVLLLEALTL